MVLAQPSDMVSGQWSMADKIVMIASKKLMGFYIQLDLLTAAVSNQILLVARNSRVLNIPQFLVNSILTNMN